MSEKQQFRLGLVGYGEIGSTLGKGLREAGLQQILLRQIRLRRPVCGPHSEPGQGGRRHARYARTRSWRTRRS